MKHLVPAVAIAVLFFNTNAMAQKKTKNKTIMVQKDASLSGNPFIKKSPLQYQAPEFDKIKDEHFKPAFDYGLKIHSAEIEKIANQTSIPTFENTILALENSGEVLKRAQQIFYNLVSANTNPKLQKLQEEYAPIFASHSDKISLNSKLWQRIKAVKTDNLDAESKKLVEVYRKNYEISGADLSKEKKEELKKINAELATLSTMFSNKILNARKKASLLISDVKELEGLTADQIATAASAAEAAGKKGQYLLSITNTTQQPLLQNLKNRATREKLFKASWYRAENGDDNDTRNVIERQAKLRLKKAQLMGKKSFAEWKLQDQMALNPEAAKKLLAQLAKPAVETAKKERSEIQALVDAQKGGFQVQPWDWNFYAEQVRKEKYDLDESEITPYFELNNVLEKGVFYAAEEFFGIKMKKREDLPVYHPDVVVYEVFDNNGESFALFYFDFFARSNKSGGAWMNNFVDQAHSLGQKPVIINVLNYQKPSEGKPALISYDEVTTLFHEFGHGLHGLFANQKYATLSGTNVPRDFVELPSQLNEFFALEPKILKNYALHYQTQEPMPQTLVDKIKKAITFNQGYATTESVSAATLDMAWHSITDESQIKSALEFEKEWLNNFGFTLSEVPPRYHSPYFSHIWGGGYSAGYYAYMWADMLNTDAWEYIQQNGGMTRENGERYRKHILSVGNSVDLNQAYKDFTGREPSPEALLRNKGFIK